PVLPVGRVTVGLHQHSLLLAADVRDAHHRDGRRAPARIDDWNRSSPSASVPPLESLPTSWRAVRELSGSRRTAAGSVSSQPRLTARRAGSDVRSAPWRMHLGASA